MSTATEAFRSAMSNAGLTYTGEIYADGKLHRFKAEGDNARNSWFVFHSDPPAAGAFGCWKRGAKEKWCERNGNLSQAQTIAIAFAALAASRMRNIKAETAARQKQARQNRRLGFSRAQDQLPSHAYLTTNKFSHTEIYESIAVLWYCHCATRMASFTASNSSAWMV